MKKAGIASCPTFILPGKPGAGRGRARFLVRGSDGRLRHDNACHIHDSMRPCHTRILFHLCRLRHAQLLRMM